MTAVDPLAAAVAELGALPMPVGVKPFQTVPPRPADADVTLTVVEAAAHLSWLQAHPVPADAPLKDRHDWMAAAFRDLAACHPEACATAADYPDFHPGGGA